MDARTITAAQANPAAAAALAVAAGSAATILGAFYFQYVVGLFPCPLCLEQRYFHYAAIPLALIVAIAAYYRAPRPLILAGLAVVALLLLAGAALAVYHAGVEWKWWAGPQDCSGPLNPIGGNLLDQLKTINVVRCDEAAWRLLGVSMAGWNALISVALAAIAGLGIVTARRSDPRVSGNPV